VNGELEDHPEAVNSKPHETWMIRMTLTEPVGSDALLDSSQYQALLT
jgi:glycine cleavage system H lipoate-binding protein